MRVRKSPSVDEKKKRLFPSQGFSSASHGGGPQKGEAVDVQNYKQKSGEKSFDQAPNMQPCKRAGTAAILAATAPDRHWSLNSNLLVLSLAFLPGRTCFYGSI